MRVFVYEDICGGGMVGCELDDLLVDQGYAMLCAVVADFVAGGAQVVTTVDDRLRVEMDGVEVRRIEDAASLDLVFNELRDEMCLVIAPEFDRRLETLSRAVESTGGLLGCQPDAVALCSDKLALGAHLQDAGVSAPFARHYEHGGHVSDDVVVKPRFGAGCEKTYRVCAGSDEWPMVVGGHWIVQSYCEGVAVSASFIVHESHVISLLAGKQLIDGDYELEYNGGRLPLDDGLHRRAMELGHQAVRCVDGLRGFVGVDMVLGEEEEDDVVIEINPRVTMSYIGLQALCETNLGMAMMDADAPIEWAAASAQFDVFGNVLVEQS